MNQAVIERAEKTAIQNWINMLQRVRREIGDIPVQMLATLLEAALEDGLSIQDIETRLKMSKAAASRNVLALTQVNARREEGYGLLITRDDQADRRRKLVSLTPKGERVVKALLQTR